MTKEEWIALGLVWEPECFHDFNNGNIVEFKVTNGPTTIEYWLRWGNRRRLRHYGTPAEVEAAALTLRMVNPR